jgi:hypothetical protein
LSFSALYLPFSHDVNILNIVKFEFAVRIIFVATPIGHVGHSVDFWTGIEYDQLEALIDVRIGDFTQQFNIVVARSIDQAGQWLTGSSDCRISIARIPTKNLMRKQTNRPYGWIHDFLLEDDFDCESQRPVAILSHQNWTEAREYLDRYRIMHSFC